MWKRMRICTTIVSSFLVVLTPLPAFAGSLFGKVTSNQSAPLADVAVHLLDSTSGTVLQSTISNASGDYQFVSVSDGTYAMSAIPPVGSQWAEVTIPELTVTGNTQWDIMLIAPITLPDEVSVMGSLHDDLGQPLSGVQVALLRGSVSAGSTTTDANGNFSFDIAPNTLYRIRLRLGPWCVSDYHYMISGYLTILENSTFDLIVPHKRTLSVQVLDEDAAPVAGAYSLMNYVPMSFDGATGIAFAPHSSGATDGRVYCEATVNASGQATALLPPAETAFTFDQRIYGLTLKSVTQTDLHDDLTLSFVVPRLHTLTVSARDPDGAYAASSVYVYPTLLPLSAGALSFTQPTPGTQVRTHGTTAPVTFQIPRNSPFSAKATSRDIRLADSDTLENQSISADAALTLTLPWVPMARLSGTVVDRLSRGVAITLVAEGPRGTISTTSDPVTGAYEMDVPQGDAYALTMTLAGASVTAATPLDVDADTVFDLQVPATHALRLFIEDPDEMPVGFARVVVSNYQTVAATGTGGITFPAVTASSNGLVTAGADGVVVLNLLEPTTTFSIEARGPSSTYYYGTTLLTGQTLTADRDQHVALPLRPPAVFQGTLSDEHGPVSASIKLTAAGFGTVATFSSGPDGAFLATVPAAQYDLTITRTAQGDASGTPFDVVYAFVAADALIDQDMTRNIVIPAYHYLTVNVQNRFGVPVTNAQVQTPSTLKSPAFVTDGFSFAQSTLPSIRVNPIGSSGTAVLPVLATVADFSLTVPATPGYAVASYSTAPITSDQTISIILNETIDLYRCYPTCGESGFGTWAFEDQWPLAGDYDLNDLVIHYQQIFEGVGTSVYRIELHVRLMARGASFSNGLGVQWPFAPADVQAAFLTLPDTSSATIEPESNQEFSSFILFSDAANYLPATTDCPYSNTEWACPAQSPVDFVLRIDLESPIELGLLEGAGANPFIFRTSERVHEIHLPGFAPTSLARNAPANAARFGTADDASNLAEGTDWYMTIDRHPWGLDIPDDNWKWPKEKALLLGAYSRFQTWVESSGTEDTDWFIPAETGDVDDNQVWPAP